MGLLALIIVSGELKDGFKTVQKLRSFNELIYFLSSAGHDSWVESKGGV